MKSKRKELIGSEVLESNLSRTHEWVRSADQKISIYLAFIGDNKRSNAVKAALHMVYFMQYILKPKMEAYFNNNQALQGFLFNFGIGIDVGKVLVVRGGIRGENNNDLVWAGNATNYAVKLSARCKEGYHVYISEDVYKNMLDSSKFGGDPKRNMWEARNVPEWGDATVYRSAWWWSL